MDLRQLTTLVAIADHGSFSAAARALYTVQSNVSGHIARLEKELGVVLTSTIVGGQLAGLSTATAAEFSFLLGLPTLGAASLYEAYKDRAALEAVSPVKLANNVTVPVLLIHGDADETVPVRQSVIMNDALRSAGKQVKLIRLPKADHYWDDWERKDRLTLYQETAAFLKQHLN